MADQVPVNFPAPTAPFNANYDFSDLLEQTGYIQLYAMLDSAGGYQLSRNQIESSLHKTQQLCTNAPSETTLELNFDYEFLVPQRVKGKLYVVATYAGNPNGVNSCTTKLTIEPIHYDGSTETSLAAAQDMDNHVADSDTVETQQVDTLSFDVDRYFKFGEKLRIETILSVIGGSTNDAVLLYHDGANRDFGLTDQKTNIAANSYYKIIVPFKIDS